MTTHCPCGGDTNTVSETRREHPEAHPVQRWWLRCIVCGASGPQATGELPADVAWRLLTGQPAPAAVELALAKIELRPRDRKGLVALAAKLDVSPQCLDHWQAGHAPTGDARSRLLRLIVSG